MSKINKPLSASMEDYLEMIYRLSLKSGYTRMHELSDALNVQPPAATRMVQKLSEMGLVKYEKYGILELEELGLQLGGLAAHAPQHRGAVPSGDWRGGGGPAGGDGKNRAHHQQGDAPVLLRIQRFHRTKSSLSVKIHSFQEHCQINRAAKAHFLCCGWLKVSVPGMIPVRLLQNIIVLVVEIHNILYNKK